jgi:hypothetical protein
MTMSAVSRDTKPEAAGRVLGRLQIDDEFWLHDNGVPDDTPTATLCTRLERLRWLEDTLHWAATEAAELGLGAPWMRIESADDGVDEAIADVRRQLRERGP